MKIYDNLLEYSKKNIYPMHMPGHKRSTAFDMVNPYSIDVTEVEGMDNLHAPEEMIRDLIDDMKDFYGSIETFPLVNGSTCGLMAAISSLCEFGDYILIAANCHRSIYDIIGLLGLIPIYIYPEIDKESGIGCEINPQKLEKLLHDHYEKFEKSIKAIVMTSPSYEGVVSDVESIAKISHKFKIPLLVDQAHGAHLLWMENANEKKFLSASKLGADLVVESLHKTLPSLTQTALLHICSKEVDINKIKKNLGIFESSSPSYILLSSIDKCFYYLKEAGEEPWKEYKKNLDDFYKEMESLKNLKIWKYEKKEDSKLIILAHNGPELAKKLREKYNIETEMAAKNYIIAMTSMCDSKEGFDRFSRALLEIDKHANPWRAVEADKIFSSEKGIKPYVFTPYQMRNKKKKEVDLEKSLGMISGENIYFYPPGIPFLLEGEKINEETIQYIYEGIKSQMNIVGLEKKENNRYTIKIIENT